MDVIVLGNESKWKHLLDQDRYIYLKQQLSLDTHEKLVFELIKRIDSGHGITYIGELPTEIKTLAQIHDFSIKNANFDVEYGPTIAAFISNVDQVFSIADFESWFSHLNWKSSFNYLIANDLVFSCKLGFRKNPLIPAVQLNDDDVGILGTLCKKAMTVQQVDPLLQAVESTEKDDSDDWMSE